MTNAIWKEMRRNYRLDDYSYNKFKSWYFKNYNRRIHDTLEEFLHFIDKSEGYASLQVINELKEWSVYNDNKLNDVMAIEDYLCEELGRHLRNLDEFGYIYEVRNVTIGDSSAFYDEDRVYSVHTNPYMVDISPCLHGESFLDVKKTEARKTMMMSLNGLIKK